MKKIILSLMMISVLVVSVGMIVAAKPDKCTTIQSGELLASDGSTIELGFDEFGYNYQGKMFSGRYCDYNRIIGGEYCDVKLLMKWSDEWMSNKDCDGDGKLDRHNGYDSYIGSGVWETNHQSGEYELKDGTVCKWNYFVKIVAVPADATKIGGIWYTSDNVEIGPDIWGQFAITQQVENDPCLGLHGLQYVSPAGAGLGIYKS